MFMMWQILLLWWTLYKSITRTLSVQTLPKSDQKIQNVIFHQSQILSCLDDGRRLSLPWASPDLPWSSPAVSWPSEASKLDFPGLPQNGFPPPHSTLWNSCDMVTYRAARLAAKNREVEEEKTRGWFEEVDNYLMENNLEYLLYDPRRILMVMRVDFNL